MKNNIRLFLYVGALGVAFILWQKWLEANNLQQPQQQTVTTQAGVPNGSTPTANGDVANADVPSAANAGQDSSVPQASSNALDKSALVQVKTDVLNLYINPTGGTIERAELLDYPVSKNSEEPLALLKTDNPGRFLWRSGLVSAGNNQAPTHYANFNVEKNVYQLADGNDSISVPLTWQNEDGISVSKVYTFKRGAYDFELSQTVNNNTEVDWQGFAYQQLVFGQPTPRGGIGQVSTFTGGVTSTADKSYNKIKLDEMRENSLSLNTDNGWVAMIQHYFLGAVVPKDNGNYKFETGYIQNTGDHTLSASTQNHVVGASESYTFDFTGYVGPKIQDNLKNVASKLDKTVDYGILFMIAQPMFKVLNFIHGIIGNWGWAIILMTILIKLIFFAPSAWAYKSMAKMRRLQPEMARMKERFGDDRQAMSREMMQLYKKEKVNPASGCLPMLLQIPFFIAFYWVLVESVELRQAPWLGWIQDLSSRDPYFILPIINATLMFLQQKLNPPPPDPMQAKVMMMLPLVFGFLFMWFPSGLVLYWTVSNAFSIVQQYVMNRRYGEPRTKKA